MLLFHAISLFLDPHWLQTGLRAVAIILFHYNVLLSASLNQAEGDKKRSGTTVGKKSEYWSEQMYYQSQKKNPKKTQTK